MRRRRLRVKNRGRLLLLCGILAAAILLLVGGILLLSRLFQKKDTAKMSLTPLPFTAEDAFAGTGSGLLYLHDGELHYLDFEDERREYSLEVASPEVRIAGYGDKAVVYHGSAMQIVGAEAPVEFNGGVLAIKCAGAHTAVLLQAASGNLSLLLYDLSGSLVDELTFAGQTPLDFEFYGKNAGSLLTVSTDDRGGDISSTVTTYDLVKGSTTGVIPLYGQLVERVLATEKSLFLCGTNALMRCRSNSEVYRVNVYGWEALDASDATGKPLFLYAPRSRSTLAGVERIALSEEEVSGETRTRLQLPSGSFAAYLSGDKVISFAPTGAAITNMKGERTEFAFDFTAEAAVKLTETRFLVLGGGSAALLRT